MKPKDLGYTDKWLEYAFIDHETLNAQFIEFKRGEDHNTEHYRYKTFINWLSGREKFADSEVENFLELAFEDADPLMAGSAVKELFTSHRISDNQFNLIKERLPAFGDWTTKLIKREMLIRRLRKENLTQNLLNDCVLYSKEFKEYVLIRLMAEKTDNPDLLAEFANGDYGTKSRNLARQKLRRIRKTNSNGKI